MAEDNTSNTRLRLASWNVKNMNDLTKLLYILDTLSDYEIDIALLQETGIQDGFEDHYKNYTLHFPKNEKPSGSFHGVAVAYKNSLKRYFKVLPVEKAFCDRIMHCVLQLGTSTVHFINVYAPCESATKVKVENFYLQLKEIIIRCADNDKIFFFGDFNAHIGPSVGKVNKVTQIFFTETSNKNGKKLNEFCEQNDLYICNTISKEEGNNKITHYNVPSETYHELDFLLTRNKDSNIVNKLKPCTELVYTDHFIVVVELDIHIPKPIPTQIKIDLAKFIVFLLSKEHSELTDAEVDLKKNWKCFKHGIEHLDISFLSLVETISEHHTQLRNVIGELKEAVANYPLTQKTFLGTEESKKDKAVHLIKKCLNYLNNSDFQCVEPNKEVIELALSEVILKQPVWENRSMVLFSWRLVEEIPSFKKVESFFGVLEKNSPKYDYLMHSIHSMVTAIWKYGLVPIEICFASIFTREEGQSAFDVLNLTYNAMQSIFLERWKGISSEPIPGILHFSDSADMAQSLQIMQHKCNETKRHLYMAFLKWPEISEMNVNKLIDFFLKLPFFNAFSPFADNQEKASIDIIFSYVFYVVFRHLKHITIAWPAKHDLTRAIFGQKCKSKKQHVINVVYVKDDLVILASSSEQLNDCLTRLNEQLKLFGFCINSLEGMINIQVDILVPEVNTTTIDIFSSLVPEAKLHDWFKLYDVLIASPRLLERYSKRETREEEDIILGNYFTYKENNQTTEHRILEQSLITFNTYIICTSLVVQNNEFERIFQKRQIILLLKATKKYIEGGEKSCFANIFFSKLALDYLPGEPETSFLEVCKVGLTNFKISMKTLKEKCKNVNEINRFIEYVQRL